MTVFNSRINTNSDGFRKNREEMLAHINKLQELNARGAMISEKRKPRFEARGQLTPRERLARLLDLPIAAVSKQRIDDTTVEAETMIGLVKGRDAIIYDDEVATAGTVVETVRLLEERGARSIRLMCAHGLFTGPAIERLTAMDCLSEIITTNTVPIAPEKRLPNMTILSVGSVFAETIRRILQGTSVQPLFAY